MKPVVAHHPGWRGLHRARPESGLFWLACVLISSLCVSSLLVKASLVVMIFSLAAWTEGSLRAWGKSLRFVLVFSALILVAQSLSTHAGNPLFRLGVSITDVGLRAGADMALRFVSLLSASFLFVLSTDPDALANSMIRWGIPYRYGFTLILALRFVPFFRHELNMVRDAQRMRGIQTSVRSVRALRRAIRYTFIPVLVAGLTRVDTITMAMKGRAFGVYRRRTSPARTQLTREDGVLWACGLVAIGVAVLARRYVWP